MDNKECVIVKEVHGELSFNPILSYIEKYLIFLIFKISEICAEIPFSEIYICTPKIIIIIMYYLIIFYIVILFKIFNNM